jgi:hypothetical protein
MDRRSLLRLTLGAALACGSITGSAQADVVDRAVLSAQAAVDSAQQSVNARKAELESAAKALDEEWGKVEKKLALAPAPNFDALKTDTLGKAPPKELVSLCGTADPAAAVTQEWLDTCQEKIEAGKRAQSELRKNRDLEGYKALLAKVGAESAGASKPLVELTAFHAARTAWYNACQEQITKSAEDLARLENKHGEYSLASKQLASENKELEARRTALKSALELKLDVSVKPSRTLADRLRGAREVRCYTAYCWGGDGTKYGVEPILDLPIGISWALGSGSLANYINANRVDVSVSAGLRVWFAYDIASVGVLIARPSLSNQASIELEHSDVAFQSAAVSRPFPTLVLGFWGDVFSLTASYDQLRNTDGSGAADPNYLPNAVLSRTVVLGLSINPFTAARNAVGAAGAGSGKDD